MKCSAQQAQLAARVAEPSMFCASVVHLADCSSHRDLRQGILVMLVYEGYSTIDLYRTCFSGQSSNHGTPLLGVPSSLLIMILVNTSIVLNPARRALRASVQCSTLKPSRRALVLIHRFTQISSCACSFTHGGSPNLQHRGTERGFVGGARCSMKTPRAPLTIPGHCGDGTPRGRP